VSESLRYVPCSGCKPREISSSGVLARQRQRERDSERQRGSQRETRESKRGASPIEMRCFHVGVWFWSKEILDKGIASRVINDEREGEGVSHHHTL
jgi:hypothetical protein